MQPYQQASEEIIRQGDRPIKALRTASSLALSAGSSALGGIALSKVLPFLNKYIPEDLAIKGLSKLDPRFGKFINKAMSNGKSFDEVRGFIEEKATEQRQPAKEERNIIEQYSPELHQFLTAEIQKGRKPIEAGALAQNDKRFSEVIKKLMKDHKTNWSDIIQSIYGSSDMAQSQQMQPQQQGVSDQDILAAIERILKL